MDRFNAMRAFAAVVSEGSFTRAAERLETSPQLVSKYVSWLEEHLGVRLLNRSTRRLHLTEEGSRSLPRMQHLLAGVEALERGFVEREDRVEGKLRITAPVSFAARHLAPLLCDFQQRHPAVEIDLQLNDRKTDLVEEGFDVALRIGQLKNSSLVARRIVPVRMVLCAAPAYLARHGVPRSVDELQGHRYLRYSYMESVASPQLRAWMRGSADGEGGFTCNNGDVLTGAALAGAGIALQPTFIAGPAIAEGRLQVLLPDLALQELGLYAVYVHRQLLPAKVRHFVDFLQGYFGDPPYWDQLV
ncbi:LysR family transcriptional regulator [Parahaliea aestuarii]|uniref:LysR family transcriptional regulator n=1 Tax=Parahaliea aestuarii TaxID=1852021 RepID=A0A5C9A0W4_9GAMM|nr:LysR family transcriptional regulator [Parahaliea aestuarii]TXS93237.1 LysR family transcriptional regulator [Parahaliea aestuarii]